MFFRWLSWLLNGKPMLKYDGYNCGLCGKWIVEEFFVPTWDSNGEWWDTWDICDKCMKEYGDD